MTQFQEITRRLSSGKSSGILSNKNVVYLLIIIALVLLALLIMYIGKSGSGKRNTFVSNGYPYEEKYQPD